MRLTTVTLGTGLGLAIGLLASTAAFALDTARLAPKEEAFSFEGPFGTYDRGALQRGYQVYKEVCAACHSAQHLAFHNLAEAGGPEFSEAQARALAAVGERFLSCRREGCRTTWLKRAVFAISRPRRSQFAYFLND